MNSRGVPGLWLACLLMSISLVGCALPAPVYGLRPEYPRATLASGTARGPSRPRETRRAMLSQESALLMTTAVLDPTFTTVDIAPSLPDIHVM